MSVKVEQHPRVVRYIRQECSAVEQDEYFRTLARIRLAPIKNSEATSDPSLAKYVLRFFRFGSNIAVFEFNIRQNRIRVLECRRFAIRKKRRGGGGTGRLP